MPFTIGADPEFALQYDNRFVNAMGVLPDKKKAIKENGNKFYFDNVMAEFQLVPSQSKVQFNENIKSALVSLNRLIGDKNLKIQAAAEYSDAELVYKKSFMAGCNPELSAYTTKQITLSKDYIITNKKTGHMTHVTNMRTAGGHIHLGGSLFDDDLSSMYVVKMLDLFLATTEIFFNNDPTAKQRRKVYGQAGSHRLTSYGIEYRTLSNYWLSSPVYVNLVYDICDFVLNFVENKKHLMFWQIDEELYEEGDAKAHCCTGYDPDQLVSNINKMNKKSAEKFLTFILNYFPDELCYSVQDAVIYKPQSLEAEWGIYAN